MSLFAINLAMAGTAMTTYADDPRLNLNIGNDASTPAEWTAFEEYLEAQAAAVAAPPVVVAAHTPAAAPQAPIEAPAADASGGVGTVAATGGGAAPATMQLPATGTGERRGSTLPLIALLVAAGGVACIGVSRMVRSRRSG